MEMVYGYRRLRFNFRFARDPLGTMPSPRGWTPCCADSRASACGLLLAGGALLPVRSNLIGSLDDLWLHSCLRRVIIIFMQELLSKADDRKIPLSEQEFYELRLDDSTDIWRPGFIVKEAHAQWSEIDRQIMWDDLESERLPTLEEAKERYEARRLALFQRGFIHSDMDLF